MARKASPRKKIEVPAELIAEVEKHIRKRDRARFYETAIRKELKKRLFYQQIQKAFGPFEPSEKTVDRLAKIYALIEEASRNIPFAQRIQGRSKEKKKTKARKRGQRKKS